MIHENRGLKRFELQTKRHTPRKVVTGLSPLAGLMCLPVVCYYHVQKDELICQVYDRR